MVLFPPGEVLLWDFFRGEGLPHGIPSWGAIWYQCGGKVCHMVFLHGEHLPYGIISGGQSAMVFVPSS